MKTEPGLFPWSKDHALIEVRLKAEIERLHKRISMVERSWPH